MVSRAAKARAVAEGSIVGGVGVAAVGATVNAALGGLVRVAPRAGAVVSRALPWAGALYIGGSAGAAAYRSWNAGDNFKDVMRHAALGAIGMDTYVRQPKPDGVRPRPAEDGLRPPGMMRLGGPQDGGRETMEQAEERLGKNLGGSPNDLKLAAENSRRMMGEAKSQASRNAHERRALQMERRYFEKTGVHIGPTLPPASDVPKTMPVPAAATPPPGETWGQRMMRRAGEGIESFVFGEKRPKVDDAMAQQRKSIEGEIASIRKEMDDESRSGRGPNYTKLSGRLDTKQAELNTLTNKQAEKEREELAAYRQVAALGVGALVGLGLGRMTVSAAESKVAAAEKGIVKLADKAAALVGKSKRGVIAGTIEGDKAAAAVSAANKSMTTPIVSMAEAYGIPGVNLAHGAGMYGYAATHKDDPAAPVMRMEGAGAMAAGVLGMKYAVMARALRPAASPDVMGKLKAAGNRLLREGRTGAPASVAQSKARAAAGTASVNASASVQVASNRAGGRVAASAIDAKRPAVTSGARLGEAKAMGASRVGVAEARGKRAVTNEVKRGQQPGPYKDTWQDSRGRIYHRKDTSVRKPSARRSRAANDNSGGSGRRAG